MLTNICIYCNIQILCPSHNCNFNYIAKQLIENLIYIALANFCTYITCYSFAICTNYVTEAQSTKYYTILIVILTVYEFNIWAKV